MVDLQSQFNTAIVLISHDLGVVARLCRTVAVMYAGRIVETGPAGDIFKDPQHPFTRGLLQSVPRLDRGGAEELATIPGQPPNLQGLPSGCAFFDRCPCCEDICLEEEPVFRTIGPGRMKACHQEHL